MSVFCIDTFEVSLLAHPGAWLQILENSEGGSEGTLLKHLDHCVTAFGRRALRNWVSRFDPHSGWPHVLLHFAHLLPHGCRPLGRIAAIEERLTAVEDLMKNDEVGLCQLQLQGLHLVSLFGFPRSMQLRDKVREVLKTLPDLERLLSRIHANALGKDA